MHGVGLRRLGLGDGWGLRGGEGFGSSYPRGSIVRFGVVGAGCYRLSEIYNEHWPGEKE